MGAVVPFAIPTSQVLASVRSMAREIVDTRCRSLTEAYVEIADHADLWSIASGIEPGRIRSACVDLIGLIERHAS